MVALHSTMFLLILQIAANIIGEHIVFTFHNVSINTERRIRKTKREVLFTFHNVSINTETREAIQGVNYNTLHSTMFLLIRKRHRKDHEQGHDFTFHNVSINTEY